jgi:hypothetical protein
VADPPIYGEAWWPPDLPGGKTTPQLSAMAGGTTRTWRLTEEDEGELLNRYFHLSLVCTNLGLLLGLCSVYWSA